jgi:hypothetical protein
MPVMARASVIQEKTLEMKVLAIVPPCGSGLLNSKLLESIFCSLLFNV